MNKFPKNTAILFALAIILSRSEVVAQNPVSTLTGHFEGGDAVGKFTFQNSPSGTGLLITYYSPIINKTFLYNVLKYDECSAMAMYAIPNTHQIAIDGSCSSQGGQIYKYIYEWNSEEKNWCLIREITGEKPDISASTVVSSEQVARIKGCTLIGSTGQYAYESNGEVMHDITQEINRFKSAQSSKEALSKYLKSIQDYDISEISAHIDTENVKYVNDLAYFLSENGRSYEAIKLLTVIVSAFPDRVVAKLNLADAYWGNSYKKQAAQFYKKYYNQMLYRGLKSEVPARVYQRANSQDNINLLH